MVLKNTKTQPLFQQPKPQVFHRKSQRKQHTLESGLIRLVQLLTTQKYQLFTHDSQKTILHQARSKDSFLSRQTWHTIICAGRKIRAQVSMTLRKQGRSSLIQQDRIKFSSPKFLTAKTKRKGHYLLALVHTKPLYRLKSRLKITHETTQMVLLLAKSHRASYPRQSEESSGSMREKHRILDRHLQKIQDLGIMNTQRKKTILKIE